MKKTKDQGHKHKASRVEAPESTRLEQLEHALSMLSDHHEGSQYKPKSRAAALERAHAYLESDENLISTSRVELPAVMYRSMKDILGITNAEYQRIFNHTWRSVTQKAKSEPMNSTFSERLFLITRIYIQGLRVFGSLASTRSWLNSHSPVLGTAPVSLLDTVTGCHKVSDELGRIEHGLLA